MIAATIPDLDGLGLLFGTEYYLRFHHVLGHGLLVGALTGIVLERTQPSGLRIALLYISLFYLHLLLDSFGSGVGWGLALLWPFSSQHFVNPYAWDFQGWQNISALFTFAIWAWVIAMKFRRSPFEVILPKLESRLFPSKG